MLRKSGLARPGPQMLSQLALVCVSAYLATCASGQVLTAPQTSAAFWTGVTRDINAVINVDLNRAPTLVRLAFHMCGTYNKTSNTGGCGYAGDAIWNQRAHIGNAGLMGSLGWLDDIYFNNPGISYGDLYTLASALALKRVGGPAVAWRAGRIDAVTAGNVTAVSPTGRLPAANEGVSGTPPRLNNASAAATFRTQFASMGFNDTETVALIGAHCLGRAHLTPRASGNNGSWTDTPTTFNNAFFVGLMNRGWDPTTLSNGQLQFQERMDPPPGGGAGGAGPGGVAGAGGAGPGGVPGGGPLPTGTAGPAPRAGAGRRSMQQVQPQPPPRRPTMRLPSDMVLRFDARFAAIATAYAASNAKFTQDFAAAFGKLLELGSKGNLVTVPVTI